MCLSTPIYKSHVQLCFALDKVDSAVVAIKDRYPIWCYKSSHIPIGSQGVCPCSVRILTFSLVKLLLFIEAIDDRSFWIMINTLSAEHV